MSSSIDTLVGDIHQVLEGKNPLELLDKDRKRIANKFGQQMVDLVSYRVLGDKDYTPSLRISNIGKPCERQIWLGIHKHEEAEPLRPETRLKFLYGDVIEELLLLLAELAGHKVEYLQKEVELEGVTGHIDALIDGMLVDVKSASTYSFRKFAEGGLAGDDPFGYIGQIQTYLEALQKDKKLTVKDRCGFLVMDKTLGHICLDIHKKVPFDVREITKRKVEMVSSDKMPDRAFEPVPDGKSGNMKLPMQCSYCNMKYACHPDLRTFLYSNGPRFLTKVEKLPDVHEVSKEEALGRS